MSQLLQEHELRPVVQVLELAVQVQVLALEAREQSASIRPEVQPTGQGLVGQERSR